MAIRKDSSGAAAPAGGVLSGARAAAAAAAQKGVTTEAKRKHKGARSKVLILSVVGLAGLGLAWVTKAQFRGAATRPAFEDAGSEASDGRMQQAAAIPRAATDVISPRPPIIKAEVLISPPAPVVVAPPVATAVNVSPPIASPAGREVIPAAVPAPASVRQAMAPIEPAVAGVEPAPSPPRRISHRPALPVSNEVICFAGCANDQIRVVYRGPVVALSPRRDQAVERVAFTPSMQPSAQPKSTGGAGVIACFAGCYITETQTFDIVATRRQPQPQLHARRHNVVSRSFTARDRVHRRRRHS